MVKNLLKTPLMAILYAALMEFAAAFLPFGEAYREAMQGFGMPVAGRLILVGYGFLISVILALLFSSASMGLAGTAMTGVTMVGLQWGLDAFRVFWFGDPSGAAYKGDLLMLAGSRAVCTLLLLVLAALLFAAPAEVAKVSHKEGKGGKSPYQMKIFPHLVLVLAGLPILFILLYLTLWYFLGWNSEAVRVYYGSAAGDEGFVPSVIGLLLSDGTLLLYCLIAGLLHPLLTLPLMTRMPGKRVIFLAAVVLLSVSPALLRLIPTPLIPAEVQMKLLIQELALRGVYGLLSGLLLHLSYRKQAAAPKGVPPKREEPKASRGPTPKQQAGAIQMTMKGK